jgi:hypothetical protein
MPDWGMNLTSWESNSSGGDVGAIPSAVDEGGKVGILEEQQPILIY